MNFHKAGGNRTRLTDSSGAYIYYYDGYGRLLRQRKNGVDVVFYEYDGNGRVRAQPPAAVLFRLKK